MSGQVTMVKTAMYASGFGCGRRALTRSRGRPGGVLVDPLGVLHDGVGNVLDRRRGSDRGWLGELRQLVQRFEVGAADRVHLLGGQVRRDRPVPVLPRQVQRAAHPHADPGDHHGEDEDGDHHLDHGEAGLVLGVPRGSAPDAIDRAHHGRSVDHLRVRRLDVGISGGTLEDPADRLPGIGYDGAGSPRSALPTSVSERPTADLSATCRA